MTPVLIQCVGLYSNWEGNKNYAGSSGPAQAVRCLLKPYRRNANNFHPQKKKKNAPIWAGFLGFFCTLIANSKFYSPQFPPTVMIMINSHPADRSPASHTSSQPDEGHHVIPPRYVKPADRTFSNCCSCNYPPTSACMSSQRLANITVSDWEHRPILLS